jgi:hypothetical protein
LTCLSVILNWYFIPKLELFMAMVVIHTSVLSRLQKQRIGDRVIEALHNEGLPASTVVVLFKAEAADIYLDGGLLHEAAAALSTPQTSIPSPGFVSGPPAAKHDYRTKARRSRQELDELKSKLVALLQDRGALSSFEAQDGLDLSECDWAPATLRRFFADLEAEGVISKQGQKRGTRYVWKGVANLPSVLTPVRLVKKEDSPEP